LDFSSSTKARILWVKENLSNNSYNLGTIIILLVSKNLNNPTVTCFGSWLVEIKFITIAKTSHASFSHIHKSKVQVANKQLVNANCM
jgi:hypothetical protein